MNGGISLSRNASSSSLNATSSGDQAKSIANLTLPSGRRYRASSMDFTFSPEQVALRDAVRAFLAAEAPSEYVRRMAEHDDAGHHARGVAQDRRPRLDGSARARVGRAVSASASSTRSSCRRRWAARCSPARSSRPRSSRRSRRAPSVSTISSRRSRPARERGTVALDEAGYGDPIERVHVRADGRGTRYKLDGVKPMVLDGLSADWVLVPARTREGLQTFLVERPDNAEPVASLDVTRKFARFEFDETRAHARRSARRPRRHLAPHRRRRGRAARRRADRRERGREPARARLRAGARGVRQAAVEVPGDAAQGRRHAARDRARAWRCTTRRGPPTSTHPTARSRETRAR